MADFVTQDGGHLIAPPPGSSEALAQGCRCPVIDNGHGRGWLGGLPDPTTGATMFAINEGCPLHAGRTR